MKKLKLFVWSLLCAASFGVNADAIKNSTGTPKSGLAPSTYESFTTHRLKKATVLWSDRAHFLSSGFSGTARQLNSAILEAFAYMVDSDKIPRDRIAAETKRFYADRYGGPGLNGNFGSARAGITGIYQVKGLGQTPMLNRDVMDDEHSSGWLRYKDGIVEAMWSHILNAEAPHGGGKIVALIDTGLRFIPYGDEPEEPALLAVRLDPVRPAHFVPAPDLSGSGRAADLARVRDNLRNVFKIMPAARAGRGAPAIADEFTQRLAEQYAYMIANRIHHAATTPSNIEITTGMMDFGTQSAMPDYIRASGFDLKPFGDWEVATEYILNEFWQGLRKTESRLPTFSKAREKYEAYYHIRLNVEFMKVMGLPQEIAEKLKDTEAAGQLTDAINELTMIAYPSTTSTYMATMPTEPGPISVIKVLQSLHTGQSPEVTDTAIRDKLQKASAEIFAKARALAKGKGISEVAFKKYVRLAVRVRTKNRTNLYYTEHRKKERNEVGQRYMQNGRAEDVRDFVDQSISENTLNPIEEKPFELTLKYSYDSTNGTVTRKVYDALEDREYTATQKIKVPCKKVLKRK